MSKLTDSIRTAKDRVGGAFDDLIADVESVEGGTDTESDATLVSVTCEYSDGSTTVCYPNGDGAVDPADEVKEIPSEDIPDTGSESPSAPVPPGNAEQV